MESVAAQRIDFLVQGLQRGRIKAREGDVFWVETATSLQRAKQAVGCLLEPGVEDKVLCYSDPEACYILSVLEKGQQRGSALVLQGDVDLKVRGGTLGLSADTIQLTGGKLAFTSGDLEVRSLNGRIQVQQCHFLGEAFQARLQRVKIIARSFQTIAVRMIQKAERCFRWTGDQEQVKAGRFSCLVRESILWKGKRSTWLAEEKVKIDAPKIHLG
jgi:hypothetical protein